MNPVVDIFRDELTEDAIYEMRVKLDSFLLTTLIVTIMDNTRFQIGSRIERDIK